MKKEFCFICLLSFLQGQNSLKIEDFKNPFFYDSLASSAEFKLEAILQNRVKINGLWLEVGQNIKNATILEIKNDEVILKQQEQTLILTIQRNDNKVFVY